MRTIFKLPPDSTLNTPQQKLFVMKESVSQNSPEFSTKTVEFNIELSVKLTFVKLTKPFET